MKKVIVAMSGGVDSSVSAALLKKAGFDVTGMFIKCWSAEDPLGESCTSSEDERMARLAAAHIGIPFYSLNMVKEYKEKVVRYMLEGYKKGITPNPDVMCNKEIKFGLFFDKAMELGADYVATGHYARIRRCACPQIGGSRTPAVRAHLRSRLATSSLRSEDQARFASESFAYKHISSCVLLTGKDAEKDQSYFLSFIKPEVLEHVLFPIGDYTKSEVRELARKFGLPNAERKSSQGICFIGKVDFAEFLRQYIPSKEGDIVDISGKVLGKHSGAWYYTIGQRQGLGLSGGPYFVVEKDVRKNTVVVSKNEDDLKKDKVTLENVNWFVRPTHIDSNAIGVKLRYRQASAPAQIQKRNKKRVVLAFQNPQRAVTPGQLGVLYSGDHMLAAGVIR